MQLTELFDELRGRAAPYFFARFQFVSRLFYAGRVVALLVWLFIRLTIMCAAGTVAAISGYRKRRLKD